MTEFRRADDGRIDELDKKLDRVADDVRTIRDMMMSEPQASPMGRALIAMIVDDRKALADLRNDLDPVEVWYQQARGIWRFVLGVATVLSIVGAFFGIAAYFGHP